MRGAAAKAALLRSDGQTKSSKSVSAATAIDDGHLALAPAAQADAITLDAMDVPFGQPTAKLPHVVTMTKDALAISGRYHRMVRATRGVHAGSWFCEWTFQTVRSGNALPGSSGSTTGPAVRLGWASESAERHSPIGYDQHSYAYRSEGGNRVHQSVRKPYGRPWKSGDVIGCLISFDTPQSWLEEAEGRDDGGSAGYCDGHRVRTAYALSLEKLSPAPSGSGAHGLKCAACDSNVAFVGPQGLAGPRLEPAAASASGAARLPPGVPRLDTTLERRAIEHVLFHSPLPPQPQPWEAHHYESAGARAGAGADAYREACAAAGASVPDPDDDDGSALPPRGSRFGLEHLGLDWHPRTGAPLHADPAPPLNHKRAVNHRYWRSSVRFFVNGEDQGIAYVHLTDDSEGEGPTGALAAHAAQAAVTTAYGDVLPNAAHEAQPCRYFPAASTYGGASVRFNAGPAFRYPPPRPYVAHPTAAPSSSASASSSASLDESIAWRPYCEVPADTSRGSTAAAVGTLLAGRGSGQQEARDHLAAVMASLAAHGADPGIARTGVLYGISTATYAPGSDPWPGSGSRGGGRALGQAAGGKGAAASSGVHAQSASAAASASSAPSAAGKGSGVAGSKRKAPGAAAVSGAGSTPALATSAAGGKPRKAAKTAATGVSAPGIRPGAAAADQASAASSGAGAAGRTTSALAQAAPARAAQGQRVSEPAT